MTQLIFKSTGSAIRLSRANDDGNTLTILLKSDDVLCCDPDGCAELGCVVGTIWVTRENDPRDHILGARDGLSLQSGKRHIICAMTDALVSVRGNL